MITIFYDFRQQNWRFLKNQCYDQMFEKITSSFEQKTPFFRQIFRRKYLKNRNIGPSKYLTNKKQFKFNITF
jgi:hypothetical protein